MRTLLRTPERLSPDEVSAATVEQAALDQVHCTTAPLDNTERALHLLLPVGAAGSLTAPILH